jgi:hypothetical protein
MGLMAVDRTRSETGVVPDIEAALDHYQSAMQNAGYLAWRPPATEDELGALADAVSPLLVPQQLVATWRRFREAPFWLLDPGDFVSPTSAREAWLEGRDPEGPLAPPQLLMVSHVGLAFSRIELGTPGLGTGGALLFDDVAAALSPVVPELAIGFGFVADALDSGAVTFVDGLPSDTAVIERELAGLPGRVGWPDHLRSPASIDPLSPLTWPTHWQHAANIDPNDAIPRGSDSTLLDLSEKPAGQSIRVHVRVVGLRGSWTESYPTVSDPTGSIECWCPTRADRFSALRIRTDVEMEIHRRAPEEAPEVTADVKYVVTDVRPLTPSAT